MTSQEEDADNQEPNLVNAKQARESLAMLQTYAEQNSDSFSAEDIAVLHKLQKKISTAQTLKQKTMKDFFGASD